MTPYRDELTAARSRIEILQQALDGRVCERCAVPVVRPLRRPYLRALLAIALALLTGTMAIVTTTSLVAAVTYRGRGCRRMSTDR
jgi:hypothetical protein